MSLQNLSPQDQDDLTIRQQEQISAEISSTTPLLSSPLPLTTLLPLYSSDPIYTQKINSLSSTYTNIRQTRPDGNCFFRAFLFGIFENCAEDEGFYLKIKDKFEGFKEFLAKAGYTQFTVEDFLDNFGEALSTLRSLTVPQIHQNYFTDASVSDYLLVFLRILTAAELKNNCDFYQNFLDDDLETFIQQEVEPMYKESDQIHIIALSTVFDVGVKIVYLDRGEGGGALVHEFPEGAEVRLKMLYRPGHYDLVY